MQDKWEDQIRLGEEANRIYQSELVQGFFSDTERALWEAFKASRADDYDGRENVYAMLKLLSKFQNSFEHYIAGGKMAKEMLEKMEAGAFDNL
jgi:hypothetical protein